MSLDTDTLELAEVYAVETGHALHVCAAFILEGMEPPGRHIPGFSSAHTAIIQAHYAKFDPHGRSADDSRYAIA